ncbi:hypothetical protein [Klebsiella pneumoniae]|uniref:hypothetical protein n=1 Tax=Klebsiella pneumoniae TaxID=573 RepID=UPI001034D2AF|nr:hypothetical protein [Klebsiella pneumoniae]HCB0898221.1 hypothetical protein [Klebsiella variicola subsp. variicola]EKX1569151.1 hypothetical protein [Klebsiella pneumoniae]EMA2602451.1 hypothetical protein [Klebsiella pneumoniae]MBK5744471.1 hypothetical protein [Klebsiella pneumoniae]MBK5785215.1 hypothetical protein [Klebsiella pneumoniae]
MSSTERKPTVVPVNSDEFEIRADVVSMTPYQSGGVDVVNFAFMGPKVSHYANEQGQITGARVDIVKFGSVTLSKLSVQEFHRALTTLIEGQGWKYD